MSDGTGRFGEKRVHEKNTSPTVQHGDGSILLWARVAARGTGNISLLEGRMDSVIYQQPEEAQAQGFNLALAVPRPKHPREPVDRPRCMQDGPGISQNYNWVKIPPNKNRKTLRDVTKRGVTKY